jgi:outer membrane immunogenic protein
MKKLLLAGIALVALAGGSAFAADLAPAPEPYYKAPPPLPPPCIWCGWYVGVNAGWVGSDSNTIRNTGTDTDGGGIGTALAVGVIPAAVNDPLSGFIGGGQIGYNWERNRLVFGIEADFDGVSAKNTVTNFGLPVAPITVPVTTTFSRELDWLSTVRGRIGFTATPTFLIYATGGVAFGQTKIGLTAVAPAGVPPLNAAATTTTTAAGATVGAGVEWMFAPHWSVKAEYLYADLGRHSATINYAYGANTSSVTSSVRDDYSIARAGIDWHF